MRQYYLHPQNFLVWQAKPHPPEARGGTTPRLSMKRLRGFIPFCLTASAMSASKESRMLHRCNKPAWRVLPLNHRQADNDEIPIISSVRRYANMHLGLFPVLLRASVHHFDIFLIISISKLP
jgi:hypothetical protein